MLTVLTSGKAAPGVSTSAWALALSWPGPVLLADCDPAGGDLAAGLLAGRVGGGRGLLSWSSAARRGVPALAAAGLFAEHAVSVPERPDVWLLAGFGNAAQAQSLGGEGWQRLGSALASTSAALGRDVLADSGRLVGEGGCWPVLRSADAVLLTVRPSVRSVRAARDAAQQLQAELGDLGKVTALVVGDGPYTAGEVSDALQIPLAARFPTDRPSAAALSDGAPCRTKTLARSALLRAAAALARTLSGSTQDEPVPTPPVNTATVSG